MAQPLVCALAVACQVLVNPTEAWANDGIPPPPMTSTLAQALAEAPPEAVYQKYAVNMTKAEASVGNATVSRHHPVLRFLGLLFFNEEIRRYLESNTTSAQELPSASMLAVHRSLAITTLSVLVAAAVLALPSLPLMGTGVLAGGALWFNVHWSIGIFIGGTLIALGVLSVCIAVLTALGAFPALVAQVLHAQSMRESEERAARVFNTELRQRLERLSAAQEPLPPTAPNPAEFPPQPLRSYAASSVQLPQVDVADSIGCISARELKQELGAVLSTGNASGMTLRVRVESVPGQAQRSIVATLFNDRDEQVQVKELRIGADECRDAQRILARMVARHLPTSRTDAPPY